MTGNIVLDIVILGPVVWIFATEMFNAVQDVLDGQ